MGDLSAGAVDIDELAAGKRSMLLSRTPWRGSTSIREDSEHHGLHVDIAQILGWRFVGVCWDRHRCNIGMSQSGWITFRGALPSPYSCTQHLPSLLV